jgi:hypothetical protein
MPLKDTVTANMPTHLTLTVACFLVSIACQSKLTKRENQGLGFHCSEHFGLLAINNASRTLWQCVA